MRRAELNQIPFIKYSDAVRHAESFAPVMRDVNGCHSAFLADPPDFQPHGVAQPGVEIGKRFVKQKDRGVHRQCTGEGDPLLLSAGKRLYFTVRTVGETHEFEHFRNRFPDSRFLFPLNLESERDVFKNVHVRPESIILKDHCGFALFRRKAGYFGPVEQD